MESRSISVEHPALYEDKVCCSDDAFANAHSDVWITLILPIFTIIYHFAFSLFHSQI